MTDQQPPQNLWYLMRQNFPWRQFITGALIPIVIFYIFYRFGKPLTGALLAAGWGVGVAAITHLLFKKINLFAALSVPFTLIELVGTIVTLNPKFYLATSAIEHTLWGLIYLGSLLFSRPLILIFAEAMGATPKSKESIELGCAKLYRSAWAILTGIWGIVYLIAAILLIASQIWLPLESFLIIRTAFGIPKIALLLTFSFWFPGWYWNRSRVKANHRSCVQ